MAATRVGMFTLLSFIVIWCVLPAFTSAKRIPRDAFNEATHTHDDVSEAVANFTLSGVITSNMVFQLNEVIIVWGWGIDGSSVNVSLGESGPSGTTIVSDGKWNVTLPPQQAGGPYVLSVGHSAGIVELDNVYVGEVLLCSGQSNMQFTVDQSFNATEEVQSAGNYSLIRLYTVFQKASKYQIYDTTGYGGGWLIASPESVGAGKWTWFSAICYYTGRRLFEYLSATEGQIAVGLVCSRVGGTPIQAWSSYHALKKCPEPVASKGVVEKKAENIQKGEEGWQTLDEPSDLFGVPTSDNSVLWNGMIVPILNLRFRGCLWDQAETDLEDPPNNGWVYYKCWFPTMIEDWRMRFNCTLPFYFVQLPGYSGHSNTHLPDMRLAQAVALSLPNTGMAVTYDIPDPTSPYTSIHNRDKEDVAQRLWLAMEAITYNVSGVVYQGPTIANVSATTLNTTTQQVTFSYLPGTAEGLVAKGVEQCTECCEYFVGMWIFATAENATNWLNATVVELNGNEVIAFVNGFGDNVITMAKYAYQILPQCALKNMQGLPAPPFVWPAEQKAEKGKMVAEKTPKVSLLE